MELSDRRILLVGAETEAGRAVAARLIEEGAHVALVASSADAEAAFTVQRLSRRLGAAVNQAIDANNEMAVRVMVRQVAKQLGGLDAVVVCSPDARVRELMQRAGEREMQRSGGGQTVFVDDTQAAERVLAALAGRRAD